MFITIIESTFKEYPFNGTFLSPSMDEAREYAIEMIEDIQNHTTNERQKKFAGFLINKLKTEEAINYGYGDFSQHLAVQTVTKEEYESELNSSKEILENRINTQKKRLKELCDRYEALK